MRDDPELDIIRERGFQHEARYLADLRRRRPRRSVEIKTDGSSADRGEDLRAAAGADDRGDGRRRRRHLPGDVLRRHVPRPRRLPAPASKRPSGRRAGVRTTTRSPTRSSPGTSRRARSSRSARMSTSSRRSRASSRSGCTSRSAEARGPSSASGSTTSWPTTGAPAIGSWRRSPTRRRPAYPPAATYPDPVEHCDVCRWAAECVERRRDDDHLSLVAGISARSAGRLTDRGIPTLAALGDLALPVEPPIEDVGAGALVARPRAGEDPARGPARGAPEVRALPAGPGRRDRARSRPRLAAAAVAGRPVLRHRG